MKNIILILMLTLFVVSCGEEKGTEAQCAKDFHIEGDKCIHDAIDCSSMPGTFDNTNGECVTPCNNNIDCGEGGSCKATAFDAYMCECTAPNTLGEDKICHAPLNFKENECYNEILDTIVPIDKVATTPATFDCVDGVCNLVVDASAGGSPQTAYSNPWIYISLGIDKKIELNDSDAFNSQEWDLAFKRTVIRVNSADSGVGTVEVARADGVDFDSTTELPTLSQEFTEDSFMDSGCVAKTDQIGNPVTAFGTWYDYGGGASHAVNPRDYLYFVKSKGSTYKLKLTLYAKGVITLKYSILN